MEYRMTLLELLFIRANLFEFSSQCFLAHADIQSIIRELFTAWLVPFIFSLICECRPRFRYRPIFSHALHCHALLFALYACEIKVNNNNNNNNNNNINNNNTL